MPSTGQKVPATRQKLYAAEALIVVLCAFGLAQFANPYQAQIVALSVIFALTGVGLNILVGYTGLVSLGHVVFFAIGAYGWARLSVNFAVPLAIILPVVLSMGVASLIVVATRRVAGYYFALTTLAIGLLTVVIVSNATALTGGQAGIMGIQQTGIPGYYGIRQVLVTAALVLAVCYFLQCTLRESPMGMAMLAVRFDPAAAPSLGISVNKVKMLGFMISAIPVTIAGAFLAQLIHFAGPEQFTLETSIQMIAIAIIGGRGWRWAPMLGSVIVIALPEVLRPLGDYRLVFYGAALTVVALFLPNGLREFSQLRIVRRRRLEDVDL